MGKLDAIGRGTFHHIAPQDAVRPTNRQLRWLDHIARHGPQSSIYLHEVTADTHCCKDTTLRQLQKLRAGGLLFLPHQQRATEHAEFNSYIYDLTPKGKICLQDHGYVVPPTPVSGHWVHRYMTACVTSSIEIAARRDGVRYIPMHEILARKGAELAIPVGNRRLIPDQIFALDYGGSYRAFALEVDRGTEPVTSTGARKSYVSAIALYQTMIERGLYRDHYGLRANLLALWVFATRSRAERFLELVAAAPSNASASIFVQCIEGFQSSFRPQRPALELFAAPWRRAGLTAVTIAGG